MKSLDRLRNLMKDCSRVHMTIGDEWYQSLCVDIPEELLASCIDEIENELKERYMELQVDADGVPIHIGDEMDCGEHFGVKGVEGFIHGAVAFTVCDPQSVRICACPARMTHHYHKPTVENVLREFADEVYADADNEIHDRDFLCAKYAKKLREVMADDDR